MTNHPHSDWFLGIDLGTGSCKSVIIDPQAHVLGYGACGYSKHITTSQLEEHTPEDLVAAMVQSVRIAIDTAGVSPDACQAISIGGVYHSLIVMDKSNMPLTGVMTWVDDRSTKQAQTVHQAHNANAVYQQTGCPVHTIYPLSKLIWLREEQPQTFRKAARFISGKEYVLNRLTGEYLVDFGVAAGSGLLNTHTLDWDATSLDLAGITPDQLSPLVSPRQIVRGLNPELAAQMGVLKDTPLVVGSADAVNSSLGACAVLPGQATCMIGTSGAFRIIAPRPILDQKARSWCYAIDLEHWLVGGAINNAGLSLTWLRDALTPVFQNNDEGDRISFDSLVALAAQIKPGAEGLVCLPFFTGERSPYWNMHARGVFFGLSLEHDIRHMARSLMEGVAYRLRSVKNVLTDLDVEVNQIRASGGFTHSELWPQIIASVLNHDLVIPTFGETTSMGAAFWALMGMGVVDRFEDLHSLVPIANTFPPNPKEALLYDSLFQIYMQLYFELAASFEQISAWRATQWEG